MKVRIHTFRIAWIFGALKTKVDVFFLMTSCDTTMRMFCLVIPAPGTIYSHKYCKNLFKGWILTKSGNKRRKSFGICSKAVQ